jgi:DNA repair protein RadC
LGPHSAAYAELRIGGNAHPSQEDIATTARIMRAANIIQIPVLDHVIVARDALVYHSMFVRGTLPNVPSEG